MIPEGSENLVIAVVILLIVIIAIAETIDRWNDR
jgi:hypothetical protein